MIGWVPARHGSAVPAGMRTTNGVLPTLPHPGRRDAAIRDPFWTMPPQNVVELWAFLYSATCWTAAVTPPGVCGTSR